MVEWPPSKKEPFNRLTVLADCNLASCSFGCFPFWFRGCDFALIVLVPGQWPLPTVYFSSYLISKISGARDSDV